MTTAKPHARQLVAIRLIEADPPPTPLCFDSKRQWQDYLTGLAETGQQLTRRQDLATYLTVDGKQIKTTRIVTTVLDRIDYCENCLIGGQHQRRMKAERRCILTPLREAALLDAAAADQGQDSPKPTFVQNPRGPT